MRALTRILACTAVVGVLSAPSGFAAGGTTPARIAHPTGADVIIFHTESSPNMWGGTYRGATDVTVYGNGRIVSGDGAEMRVTERGIQRLLRDARAAGLLDDTAFGQALVTDQGTTIVAIDAGGHDRAISVYALELPEGDHGLPRSQQAARRHLRRFLHSVGDPSYWNGTLVIR